MTHLGNRTMAEKTSIESFSMEVVWYLFSLEMRTCKIASEKSPAYLHDIKHIKSIYGNPVI
jgi:hypothetical protein